MTFVTVGFKESTDGVKVILDVAILPVVSSIVKALVGETFVTVRFSVDREVPRKSDFVLNNPNKKSKIRLIEPVRSFVKE